METWYGGTESRLSVGTLGRDVAGIAAHAHCREQHPRLSHLIERKVVETGSDAFSGVIGVNGIQADLPNPLCLVERKRNEADNPLIHHGNMDAMMRTRRTHTGQVLGLLGIGPWERESRYGLSDQVLERSKDGLKGERAYLLNRLEVGSVESSDMNVRRHVRQT